MASSKTLAKQEAARNELARRIEDISQPEFIARVICGALPELNGGGRAGWRLELIQNDGTGAATLAYELNANIKVFAKLYADDSGRHSYQVLKTLWDGGFGANSRFRVSEPLGFFPEQNMLLIRGAGGTPVAAAAGEQELAEGARIAASWLVELHRSAIRVGATRYPWALYHKLMHRLAKAAAAHPALVDELIEMSDRFETLTRGMPLHFVQTHGQFRHIHVFIKDEIVTVIDLDRSSPSDPAQDVAEFLHRMRTRRFKTSNGASRAQDATRSFLAEYGAANAGNLVNLGFYWAYHTLVSLWRFMKSSTPEDPDWQPMMEFYMAEFERAASYDPGKK
jgi:phosphotransferase family enzyme